MTGTPAERRFAELILPHLDDALTLARWLTGNATDAEDVTQDACLRAFKALDQEEVANPRAWLLAITRNAAFTWLARNRPKSLVLSAEPEIEENASTAERPATPEEAAIAAADAVMIEKALTALPQVYRETIVMREIQGLSYRDIASVTGIPLGTVMSRLARARSLLMAALAESKPMTDDAGEERFSGRKTILLHAALDGELDADSRLAFEKQLADDPGFAAEYRRLAALRQAIRKLPKTQTSEDFRARITALAALAGAPQKPLSQPTDSWFGEWRSAALAASFALLLGSSLTFLALPAQGPDVMQELVAGHVRGMISGQPVDVASSDRHTVKPWFATRIMAAPQVVDLSGEGFELVGGRVEVIDDRPAAVLVFRHLKHVISVTELPGISARFGTAEIHRTAKGYSVLSWTMGEPDAKTTYVAVSDIAPGELEKLAAAFRKAVAEEK